MESFGEVCQCLTSYKDENNDFLAKTPGRHYLKQKIKINIVLKILLPLYALDKMNLGKQNIASVTFLTKMYIFNPIRRKHQTDCNLGMIYKIKIQQCQGY